MTQNKIKLCHDDPEFVSDCLDGTMFAGGCEILRNGGTWEDCRFGKDWKEPEIKFEGD